MKRLALALVFVSASGALADEHWYDRFEVGGFVDVYYAYNTNRPTSFDNFIPGEGTDAKKANQFSLGLAALEFTVKRPIIVKLVIDYGTSTEVEKVNEPAGDYIGPNVWKYIQQAYVGYRIPVGHGLTVEAGIMPCHIGFEDFVSKNNWNYTRGWVAENEPYYQAGLKLTYPFTDRFSTQLFYLNGWQNIGENNNWKTFGTGMLYALPRVSLYLNTLIGPEQPHDSSHWRFLFDGILVATLSSRWQLALNPNYGFEQMPTGDLAHWWGGAAYLRYQPRSWVALAARAEYFHDGIGARVTSGLTGTEQSLYEGTLTIEFSVWNRLLFRTEGRYDYSDALVFDGRDRSPLTGMPVKNHDQGLIVFGAVASL